VIRSTRCVALDGSMRASVSYARPGLRISVVRSAGLVFDPRVLRGWKWPAPGEPGALAHVSLPLDGHFLSRRAGEHDVRPREAIAETDFAWNELWDGRRFRLLVLEWDGAYGERSSTGMLRLTASDFAHLARVADQIEENREDARSAIAAFGARLRALGLPLHEWDPRELTTIDTFAQATADVLSRFESSLHTQPMWVDAAMSERHGRRRIKTMEQASGSHLLGLRGRLSRARITASVALLGAPRARIDHIARAVGFGSTRALARALHDAGLDSATALRGAINR
jgi:AraC-like DNA-binding protein